MFNFFDPALEKIFYLSLFALILLVIKLLRDRKKKFAVEKDPTGLWKYHQQSEFKRQDAYGETIKKESNDKNPKAKKEKKQKKRPLIAVLEFHGDMKAKQHNLFAKLVDEVVLNKDEFEEVVAVVNSPGGTVPHYGHVYAEMERVRNAGLKLTACVDVVAASGGYLVSLPAHKIIAAPFAVVGSVGVVAFLPNFRKFLNKWKITPRTFTAGKYKRTVTLTDDASPEEVARFKSQLESIHQLFRSSVEKYRPQANIAEIETGLHWTAQESVDKKLGLVDQLGTSREYLLERNKLADLVSISAKKNFWDDGVGRVFGRLADTVLDRFFSLQNARF